MPLSIRSKGLLITLTGVLFIVPDALFVRLIGGDALVTAFWRSLICGLLILLGVLLSQGKAGVATLARMGWPGWFYTAVVGFAGLGFVMAVAHTSVANVVFILASMPIFAAIFSRVMLHELIARRTVVTIACVLGGLGLVAYGSGQSAVSNWRGDLWALAIAVAYGAGLNAARMVKEHALVITVPVAYIALAAVLLRLCDPWASFAAHWPLYLGHGLFMAVATSLLTLGPRYLSAPEVALLFLLESVLSPLLVWWLMGEDPGRWALVGGAVVVCTLLVSNLLAFRRERLNAQVTSTA